MLIIGVIGGRDAIDGSIYSNQEYIDSAIEKALKLYDTGPDEYHNLTLCLGGAKGTEALALEWCKRHDVGHQTIFPRINSYKGEPDGMNKAFLERNMRIISQSTLVVFFWDGVSAVIRESIATCVHQKRMMFIAPML